VDSVSSNGVGGKVSYDYNVLGQRISRKEISGNTTNTEYYIHDGARRKLKVKMEKLKIMDKDIGAKGEFCNWVIR